MRAATTRKMMSCHCRRITIFSMENSAVLYWWIANKRLSPKTRKGISARRMLLLDKTRVLEQMFLLLLKNIVEIFVAGKTVPMVMEVYVAAGGTYYPLVGEMFAVLRHLVAEGVICSFFVG